MSGIETFAAAVADTVVVIVFKLPLVIIYNVVHLRVFIQVIPRFIQSTVVSMFQFAANLAESNFRLCISTSESVYYRRQKRQKKCYDVLTRGYCLNRSK